MSAEYTRRLPGAYEVAEDDMTAADETPDLAWARTLGPDPWGLPEPKPTTPLAVIGEPPF